MVNPFLFKFTPGSIQELLQSNLKIIDERIMKDQEKLIQVMESIWEDLCKSADSLSSPPWHEKVLKEREVNINRNEEKFIDWETAKENIKNDIL